MGSIPKSESVSHSVMSDSLRPQAPLSMELSRQEYWSGLPFPSPYIERVSINLFLSSNAEL